MSQVDRASRVLNDDFVRWTLPELLGWLGDGERAVVRRRPDACAVNTDMSLVAGPKQKLPTEAHRLIDIVRNQLGGAIRVIDRALLDSQNPSWYRMPAADTEHFVYDDRDPLTFYVYPPAPEGHLVEIIYSRMPPEPTVITGAETVAIDDGYVEAMLEYALYRAFAKDAESSPANAQRSAQHLAAFRAALGDSTNADTAMSPNNGNA
jgi:hypothetical protein